MISKEAYTQKIEAQLALAQNKLAELNSRAGSRFKYERQLDELEYMVGNMKVRLNELRDTGGHMVSAKG